MGWLKQLRDFAFRHVPNVSKQEHPRIRPVAATPAVDAVNSSDSPNVSPPADAGLAAARKGVNLSPLRLEGAHRLVLQVVLRELIHRLVDWLF